MARLRLILTLALALTACTSTRPATTLDSSPLTDGTQALADGPTRPEVGSADVPLADGPSTADSVAIDGASADVCDQDGPCDCRTTGCPDGSYCGECLTAEGSAWSCIGNGMAC